MNLAQKIARRSAPASSQGRAASPMSMSDWASMFQFNGQTYGLGQPIQTMSGQTTEPIPGSFKGVVQGAYQSNGVVFACMLARQKLFSEARFQFQRIRAGRPGDLFGNRELAILERPWVNGTTGHLLSRMIQDADLAGNAYVARRTIAGTVGKKRTVRRELRRLRPDWVDIFAGSPTDSEIDIEVIGYAYYEGGDRGKKPEILLPEVVAHFAPTPDPLARFRGMSWLTPVIREIQGDMAMREHKIAFLENAATPNLVVTLASDISAKAFQEFVQAFEAEHAGAVNAYKNLYFGGGADVKTVGADMRQMDFKVVQGAGETRIASAAGVPPIVIGLSEGMENATYSNYGQARRAFADITMRPLWREAAACLEHLVQAPGDARLWYDARDISFLQEDEKDAAEIFAVDSQAARALIDAGYSADTVKKAIAARDMNLLEHTGLFSIQLQKPGEGKPDAGKPPKAAAKSSVPTA